MPHNNPKSETMRYEIIQISAHFAIKAKDFPKLVKILKESDEIRRRLGAQYSEPEEPEAA